MRNPSLILAHAARRREARRRLARGGSLPGVTVSRRIPTLPPFLSSPPPDAEPVEAAATRLFGRKPDWLWRYATADDHTLFYTARWDGPFGEKRVRPVSWSDAGGWLFAAWPASRPLYNLPELSRRPDASVIVCEGEKAADAATTIFPDSVATTSSGGAAALLRTDWTPLLDRQVLIWPDLDEVGAQFAREVASVLLSLRCAIWIVDARALASIDPCGGLRQPKKKWDAANAAAEWHDLRSLKEAAMKLRAPYRR